MSDPRRHDGEDELERRLRSWMTAEYGTGAPGRLLGVVVDSTPAIAQRHPVLVARNNRRALEPRSERSSLRLLPIAATVALLMALALGVGIFVGSQTHDEAPPETPTGAFVPTGDIPASMGWLIRPGVAPLNDGRVLVAGGGQESPRAAVYDPATGEYGDAIPMPAMHQAAEATTLPDGRVLITGGNDGNATILSAASVFDPASGTVGRAASMTEPRETHSANVLDDGRVLIVGGFADAAEPTITASATAELYDPATDTFSPTGSLATPRADHTATKLPDGRVVIIGGFSSVDTATGEPSLVQHAEVYDPATGSFEALGSLVTPRTGHGAILLDDGRVLVVGGGRVTSSSVPGWGARLATAELFDPANGTFAPTRGSLATERSRPSLARLSDGSVLVVGGSNQFGSPRSAERFDPGTQLFHDHGATASAHGIGIAVPLRDGRIFLPGEGPGPEAGSELFLPGGVATAPEATPAPTIAPSLAVSAVETVSLRSGHTATKLKDGRVLIAGGWGGEDNGVLATAEIYDPAGGAFTSTGPMVEPRADHVATLLPDGRVLLAGGDMSATTSAEGAEVFDPETGRFESASPDIGEALAGRWILRVAGLGEGRLVLVEDDFSTALRVLDLTSGRLGPRVSACVHGQQAATALDDGRLLLHCRHGEDPLIVDPDAGPSAAALGFAQESTGVHRLADGRILGADWQDGSVEGDAVRLALTDVYDPATGRHTAIAPTGSPLPMAGTISELGDGLLLMVGGNSGVPGDAIRLLDPETWQYRDAGHLLASRHDATATLLDDGRVLIVGGANRSADRSVPMPPGAELIDPAALDLDGSG